MPTQGTIKAYLTTAAFLHCTRSNRPENTLFHQVENPGNVSFEDLEKYLDLVLALFALSPRGYLGAYGNCCSILCCAAGVRVPVYCLIGMAEVTFAS